MLVLAKQALLFLGPLPKLQPLELPANLEQTDATMSQWLGPDPGPLQKSSWLEPDVGWSRMVLSTPGSGTGSPGVGLGRSRGGGEAEKPPADF